MKAISLIQPWATLWALGIKVCETRSWSTQFRGEIFIHASKSDSAEGQALWSNEHIQKVVRQRLSVPFPPAFSELPRGVIIGKVNIVACVLMTEALLLPAAPQVIFKPEDRFSILLTAQERQCGNWQKGRFVLVGTGHTLFDTATDAKGQLGIWEYDPNQAVKERAEKEEENRRKRQSAAIARKKRKQNMTDGTVQNYRSDWERDGGASVNKEGELIWTRTGRKLVPGEPGAAEAAYRAGRDFGENSYFDLVRSPIFNSFDPTKPVKRKIRLDEP